MKSNSQAGQDLFILAMTGQKRNGTFLEIGSNDARKINNTYILEADYDWRGVMIEYNAIHLSSYKEFRPQSQWIIEDATKVDYKSALEKCSTDLSIDYLQIDLEAKNGSTINTLEHLNKTVMDTYTFGVVTFEHDSYTGNWFDTRERSRKLFRDREYVLVFPDVKNDGLPFEDWYIHPTCIPEERYKHLITNDSLDYKTILEKLSIT